MNPSGTIVYTVEPSRKGAWQATLASCFYPDPSFLMQEAHDWNYHAWAALDPIPCLLFELSWSDHVSIPTLDVDQDWSPHPGRT